MDLAYCVLSRLRDSLWSRAGALEAKYKSLLETIPNAEVIDDSFYIDSRKLTIADREIPDGLEGESLLLASAKQLSLTREMAFQLSRRCDRYHQREVWLRCKNKEGKIDLAWEEPSIDWLERQKREVLIKLDTAKTQRLERLEERLKELEKAIRQTPHWKMRTSLVRVRGDRHSIEQAIALGDTLFELQEMARTGFRQAPPWIPPWEAEIETEIEKARVAYVQEELDYDKVRILRTYLIRVTS